MWFLNSRRRSQVPFQDIFQDKAAEQKILWLIRITVASVTGELRDKEVEIV